MAQNIYDQSEFFSAYSSLPRSIGGLEAALEWPTIRSMLPDMNGLSVADLGCGYGWFCRWARTAGADRVLGINVSEKMLQRARESTTDQAISFERADLETLSLHRGSRDLVYSSLAFHYVEDTSRLFSQIRMALVAGGRLVFSVEHPIFMAPRNPVWRTEDTLDRTWPIDGYSKEGLRVTDWLAPGVVKYHRTIATTLNQLIGAGFIIERVEEFAPTSEQIAVRPELMLEVERPMFLMVQARFDAGDFDHQITARSAGAR